MTEQEQPSLKVIDGGKAGSCCQSESTTKSEDIYPPLQASTGSASEDERRFLKNLERNKLDRLRMKHSRDLFEAELAVQELKMDQAFEMILFEAIHSGVPYRTVTEAHGDAEERLEKIMGEVS